MFKHDKDVMVLKRTEKYLNIKCKYVGCKFVLWYNENKKELGKDIQLYRIINMNHTFSSHMSGIVQKEELHSYKVSKRKWPNAHYDLRYLNLFN